MAVDIVTRTGTGKQTYDFMADLYAEDRERLANDCAEAESFLAESIADLLTYAHTQGCDTVAIMEDAESALRRTVGEG